MNRQKKLALMIIVTLGLLFAAQLGLAGFMVHEHRSPILAMVSLTSCLPALTVAILAWRGKLRSRCAQSGAKSADR